MNGNGQHPPVLPRPQMTLTEWPDGAAAWECLRCTAKGRRPSLHLAYLAGQAHGAEAHP